jgi:hypothetical protein
VSSGGSIMIVVLFLSSIKCVLYFCQRTVEFYNKCYSIVSMSLIPNLNLDVTPPSLIPFLSLKLTWQLHGDPHAS